MNKNLRIAFAVLVILGGIAGIFLPIFPGIALILFGLYLINPIWIREKLRAWGIKIRSLRKRR